MEAFEIQDVFLVSTNCWVTKDLNPQAPVGEFTFGVKSNVEPEALIQERTPTGGGASFWVLRYLVTAEVRILKPGVPPEKVNDAANDNTLAELKFTFATDYRCPKDMAQDQAVIGAFSRNAHFHAWPYVREEVNAMCGRLRVPRATLQMLRPDQAQPVANLQAVQKPSES